MTRLYGERRLQVIFGVTLMGVMGVSLISPVFPAMVDHFGITDSQVGLVVLAYTLPGIVVALFIGVLADRYGRKRVLLPLLILFGVAGGGGALAPDFRTLLVLRAFQGVGGAGLVTLSTTLIGDYYDGPERGAAMGLNASILSIATATYPFVGGLLGTIGWYAPFVLFVLAVPMAVWALVELVEPTSAESVDFYTYARRIGHIAASADTLVGAFAAFLAFVVLYGGIITYFPLLVEQRFGSSSVIIGGLQSSMSVVVAIVSSQTGTLVERFSERSLFTVGFVGYGVGLLGLPLAPTAAWLLAPLAVFGLGHGLVVPSVQTFMTKLAPSQFRAATMSLYNIALRLGQTLGPVVFGALYVFGFDRLFFAGGAVAIAGFVVLAASRRFLAPQSRRSGSAG
ncbi:MFS transporter [Halanaeroarchaeum sulfurireducens]|uniref:Multidrug ABC transporter n=1 Tax=Halanaeroarchaeum sulfurireducens TaxID=1604004 RepID=A0A0F7P9S6_9EURY|nr:MFS transporter [Halanaeroarchaeum sulfurireducens]AKH96935.1 multidrug ABC transporter [Halanaeroarchaeum sulfurireducens]ALG81336.1 multidrug ABC transporter [Halanaeroarchaeum sulfurireducens]